MNAFEQAAGERITAAGVDLNTVTADSLRLEPFGGAFLLRWDGALVLTADQVMELLGATPAPTPPPTTQCWWADEDGGGGVAPHDFYEGHCTNCLTPEAPDHTNRSER